MSKICLKPYFKTLCFALFLNLVLFSIQTVATPSESPTGTAVSELRLNIDRSGNMFITQFSEQDKLPKFRSAFGWIDLPPFVKTGLTASNYGFDTTPSLEATYDAIHKRQQPSRNSPRRWVNDDHSLIIYSSGDIEIINLWTSETLAVIKYPKDAAKVSGFAWTDFEVVNGELFINFGNVSRKSSFYVPSSQKKDVGIKKLVQLTSTRDQGQEIWNVTVKDIINCQEFL